MAWVDLRAGTGLASGFSDVNAYPGQQTRIVCWPQASGSNDLVAYHADHRPMGSAPIVLVNMATSIVDDETFSGTLSGHTAGGGGGGGAFLAGYPRRLWLRRRRR